MYQHERIISEIDEILGLPLDFDEEGQCALQFDENFRHGRMLESYRKFWILNSLRKG